jgi:hypothetical protein
MSTSIAIARHLRLVANGSNQNGEMAFTQPAIAGRGTPRVDFRAPNRRVENATLRLDAEQVRLARSDPAFQEMARESSRHDIGVFPAPDST